MFVGDLSQYVTVLENGRKYIENFCENNFLLLKNTSKQQITNCFPIC